MPETLKPQSPEQQATQENKETEETTNNAVEAATDNPDAGKDSKNAVENYQDRSEYAEQVKEFIESQITPEMIEEIKKNIQLNATIKDKNNKHIKKEFSGENSSEELQSFIEENTKKINVPNINIDDHIKQEITSYYWRMAQLQYNKILSGDESPLEEGDTERIMNIANDSKVLKTAKHWKIGLIPKRSGNACKGFKYDPIGVEYHKRWQKESYNVEAKFDIPDIKIPDIQIKIPKEEPKEKPAPKFNSETGNDNFQSGGLELSDAGKAELAQNAETIRKRAMESNKTDVSINIEAGVDSDIINNPKAQETLNSEWTRLQGSEKRKPVMDEMKTFVENNGELISAEKLDSQDLYDIQVKLIVMRAVMITGALEQKINEGNDEQHINIIPNITKAIQGTSTDEKEKKNDRYVKYQVNQ